MRFLGNRKHPDTFLAGRSFHPREPRFNRRGFPLTIASPFELDCGPFHLLHQHILVDHYGLLRRHHGLNQIARAPDHPRRDLRAKFLPCLLKHENRPDLIIRQTGSILPAQRREKLVLRSILTFVSRSELPVLPFHIRQDCDGLLPDLWRHRHLTTQGLTENLTPLPRLPLLV